MGTDRLPVSSDTEKAFRLDSGQHSRWSQILNRLVWLFPLLSVSLTLASIWLFLENSKANIHFPHAITPYEMVFGFTYPVIGAFIVVRKPHNPAGWLFCLIGISGALGNFSLQYPIFIYTNHLGEPFVVGLMTWIHQWSWIAGLVGVILLILLFPEGRLASPHWRILVGFVLLSMVYFIVVSWLIFWPYRGPDLLNFATALPEQYALGDKWLRPVAFILPVGFILATISIYLKFRRASTLERQQLKWFIYTGMLFTAFFIFQIVMGLAFPRLNLFGNLDVNLFLPLFIFAFPVTVAIAILRYHLWDIDLIIRRTLQYALLTGLLALVYFGSVVLLQSTFESLTGQGSPIVIVISTLGIAALFNPLRLRIQRFIDRRFYRQKYDAEQALAEFAATARNETNLETLTIQVVDFVNKTMQPEHTSLWLRGGRE